MKIKELAVIEKLLGPLAEGQTDVKVSLFIVSSKNPRLKALRLSHLNLEERAAKLHKWGQEKRFVAAIEIGDRVFIHVNHDYIKQLSNLDGLALSGLKMTIKALSEEESNQLALITEAFEDLVIQPIIEEKKEEEHKLKGNTQLYLPRQYLSKNRLMSDQIHPHYLIEYKVKTHLSQIITKSMQQFNEARREMQKQKEADDKYFAIKNNEIKRQISQTEIVTDGIKRQDQKHQLIRAS